MTAPSAAGTGPLAGLRVVEMAGLGPAPFCAMVLADLGADVVRIERTGQAPADPDVPDRRLVLTRGRKAVGVDVKRAEGAALVLQLVERADVLLEGFRPGVMERLGLGPDECRRHHPGLVYGRVTGYGRVGPLASTPGHDINFISLAGVLDPIGRRGGPPVPPLNLLGDFGGGGMLLALGVLAALHERSRSGLGQVVDAAMVDGAALLATMVYEMRGLGQWHDERGSNTIDTGAPFYDVYATADGRYLSVGAIEPAFYRSFLLGLGFTDDEIPPQDDRTQWEALRARISEIVGGRTLPEWLAEFDGTDACVTPVLSPAEAAAHPHNRERRTFVDVGGMATPAPAPRFDRTEPATPSVSGAGAGHRPEVLVDWGISGDELDRLVAAAVVD